MRVGLLADTEKFNFISFQDEYDVVIVGINHISKAIELNLPAVVISDGLGIDELQEIAISTPFRIFIHSEMSEEEVLRSLQEAIDSFKPVKKTNNKEEGSIKKIETISDLIHFPILPGEIMKDDFLTIEKLKENIKNEKFLKRKKKVEKEIIEKRDSKIYPPIPLNSPAYGIVELNYLLRMEKLIKIEFRKFKGNGSEVIPLPPFETFFKSVSINGNEDFALVLALTIHQRYPEKKICVLYGKEKETIDDNLYQGFEDKDADIIFKPGGAHSLSVKEEEKKTYITFGKKTFILEGNMMYKRLLYFINKNTKTFDFIVEKIIEKLK